MSKPSFVMFTLRQHLDYLTSLHENTGSGLCVPTQKEIAKSIGISTNALSKIVTNKTSSINKAHLAAIIADMRKRGFNTGISDLIQYVGADPINHYTNSFHKKSSDNHKLDSETV